MISNNDTIIIEEGKGHTIVLSNTISTAIINGGDVDNITGYGENDRVTINAGKVGNINLGVGNDIIIVNGGIVDKIDLYSGVNKVTICNGTVRYIEGSSGADELLIENGNVSNIDMWSGDDKVSISGGFIERVYLNAGNDEITVSGGHIDEITAGIGDDRIEIDDGIVGIVNPGVGSDVITVGGGTVEKIDLYSGGNSILVTGGTVRHIDGSSSVDELLIDGGEVNNVDLLSGNDRLTIKGGTVGAVLTGSGDNSVFIDGGNISNISTGVGNDYVTVDSGIIKEINLGNDNDILVVNSGNVGVVNSGIGNDKIKINGGIVEKIDLYSGSNSIEVIGGNVSYVEGCSGTDELIIENGNITKIDMWSGNDTVTMYGGNIDALLMNSGDDRVIINEGTLGTINTGVGNDIITINGGTIDKIDLYSGTNNINIFGGVVNFIEGSSSADELVITSGIVAKVDMWSGNDSVIIDGGNVDYIFMNSGNDTIIINGGSVGTVKGGAGNDTYIIGNISGSIIIDQSGAGANDMDQLILDNFDSSRFRVTKSEEGNLTLALNGRNGITIQGWDSHALSSISFQDKTITSAALEDMITANSGPVTQQSVILDFMDSLDHTMLYGTNALNEAVVSCSKGLYGSAQNLIDNFIYDAVHYGGSSTDGQKSFLLNYCGIDLDNADTGAITGLDAGGLVEKNNNSVVAEPAGMSLNNLVYNYTDTIMAQDYFTGETKQFTCATVNYKGEGITLYWDEAGMQNLVSNGYVNNMNVLKKMMSGIVEAWVPAAFELIDESYGMSFADDTSVLKTLSNGNKGFQVCLDYASSSVRSSYTGSSSYSWLAAVASSPIISYINGGKITTEAKEALLINTNYFKNGVADINGNPATGSSSSQTLDRVIAHEMVHGVMAANINAVNNLPLFLKEGLAELVQGVDDSRRSELLSISNTDKMFYASSGTYNQQQVLEKMLDLDHPTYSLSTYSYATGYALLRYMAKQVEDSVGGGDISFTLDSGNLRDYEIDFMEGGFDLGPSYEESWIDYSSKDFVQVFGSY